MENVAPVETLADAGAISQIVATNVGGSFQFNSATIPGHAVAELLANYRSAPVAAEDKLDLLAELRAGIDAISAAKQALIDRALSDIHHRLEAHDADIAALREHASKLEADVSQAALSLGGSIKGHKLQAVWAKGRVSYDTKSLDAYAVANPAILIFRKEGLPSVSIRVVGGAK